MQGSARPLQGKDQNLDDEELQRSPSFPEDILGKLSPDANAIGQSGDSRNLLSSIGGEGAAMDLRSTKDDQSQEISDPLAGMPEVDKWGIKGLRTLMNNYPDYHAMVVGMDPSSLGLDMSSSE